jgi:hypothetical protein
MERQKSHSELRWAVVVLSLVWASAAHAFPGGIDTTSFPIFALGCNNCHAGGSTPTVTLECVDCGEDPPIVDPVSTHEFRLTVFEIGLQDYAGLNVSAPSGTFATGGSQPGNTQILVGTGGFFEITHTAPKQSDGVMTQFSFLWTAPNALTTVTMLGWGNAVNNNGNSGGDAASSVTLDVEVNGPTPTLTPTATDTPTPTATNTPAAGCPSNVDLGCTGGFAKGLLIVKENVPGKEKLIAKFLGGPALAQTDMGNPLDALQGGTGTEYSLCIYNSSNSFAGGLLVDRAGDTCDGNPCWKPVGKAPNDPGGPGKGYKYKDGLLASDGVLKILYKGGAAGSSKAILIGKGPNLPAGIPAALLSSTQATIQLRSSDGICLSVDVTDIKKQESDFFKAK